MSQPKLDWTAEMSPEEFQNKLYTWFEQKGILTELRSHLRFQMTDALKAINLGKRAVPEQKLRQNMSPKLQALNLLVAEYLLQKKCHYTLSVFSSEVPIISSFPDFTRTVMDMASNGNLDDVNNNLELRFESTDVWDILEAMGLPSDSEQATLVYNVYTSNPIGDPLLVCLIRLMPAALREYSKNRTEVNDINKRKTDFDSTNIVFKKLSFKDIPGPAYTTDQVLEKERKKKWIKDTMMRLKRKERSDKKKSDKLQPEISINPKEDLDGSQNNVDNIEEQVISELQKRMQDVYDQELRIAKKSEEKKCSRVLRNKEKQLAEEYEEKIMQFEEKKIKFDREMEEERTVLDTEMRMKKKYLCELAKHLHEHRNIVARTLESVQRQAELMKEKETYLDRRMSEVEHNLASRSSELHVQVQNELKAIELQTDEMRREENRLSEERTTIESMKRDLDVTKKQLEDTLKGLALGEKRYCSDARSSSATSVDKVTQTQCDNTKARNELYERCLYLKNEMEHYKRLASKVNCNPTVDEVTQTDLVLRKQGSCEVKCGKSEVFSATNNKCMFVLNDINETAGQGTSNSTIEQLMFNNDTGAKNFRSPKNVNVGANNSISNENVEDLLEADHENLNRIDLIDSSPKSANVTYADGNMALPSTNRANRVSNDNELILKNELSFRDADSSEQELLREMLKRMQDENGTLRTFVLEQRSHIRSLTSRQSELRDELTHARSAITALSAHVSAMGHNGGNRGLIGLGAALTAPPLPAPILGTVGRRGITGLGTLMDRQLGGGEEMAGFSSAPRRTAPRRPDHTNRYSLAQIREARRNARRGGSLLASMSASVSSGSRISRAIAPALPAPPIVSPIAAPIVASAAIMPPQGTYNALHTPVSASNELAQIQLPNATVASSSHIIDNGIEDLAISDETQRYDTDEDQATLSDDALSDARRRLRRLELETEAVERSYREFRTRHLQHQDDYQQPRANLPESSLDTMSSSNRTAYRAFTGEIFRTQIATPTQIQPFKFVTQRQTYDPIKRLQERPSIVENKILTDYFATMKKMHISTDAKASTSRYYPDRIANHMPTMERFNGTGHPTEPSSLVDSPLTEFRKKYEYFHRPKSGASSVKLPSSSICSEVTRDTAINIDATRSYTITFRDSKIKTIQRDSVSNSEPQVTSLLNSPKMSSEISNEKNTLILKDQNSSEKIDEMPDFIDIKKLIVDKSSSPINVRSPKIEFTEDYYYPSTKVKNWMDRNKAKHAGIKLKAKETMSTSKMLIDKMWSLIEEEKEGPNDNSEAVMSKSNTESVEEAATESVGPQTNKYREKIAEHLSTMEHRDSVLQRLLSTDRKESTSSEKLLKTDDGVNEGIDQCNLSINNTETDSNENIIKEILLEMPPSIEFSEPVTSVPSEVLYTKDESVKIKDLNESNNLDKQDELSPRPLSMNKNYILSKDYLKISQRKSENAVDDEFICKTIIDPLIDGQYPEREISQSESSNKTDIHFDESSELFRKQAISDVKGSDEMFEAANSVISITNTNDNSLEIIPTKHQNTIGLKNSAGNAVETTNLSLVISNSTEGQTGESQSILHVQVEGIKVVTDAKSSFPVVQSLPNVNKLNDSLVFTMANSEEGNNIWNSACRRDSSTTLNRNEGAKFEYCTENEEAETDKFQLEVTASPSHKELTVQDSNEIYFEALENNEAAALEINECIIAEDICELNDYNEEHLQADENIQIDEVCKCKSDIDVTNYENDTDCCMGEETNEELDNECECESDQDYECNEGTVQENSSESAISKPNDTIDDDSFYD